MEPGPLPDGTMGDLSTATVSLDISERSASPPTAPVQHVHAVAAPIAPQRVGGPAASPVAQHQPSTNGHAAANGVSAPGNGSGPSVLKATVNSVLSSASVVLRGQPGPQGQPPKTRSVYLAHLTSLRLGSRDRDDEPWAFEAREFTRQLLVGKPVTFTSSYTISPAGAPPLVFGELLKDDLNVSDEVVKNGWAKVKEDREGVETDDPRKLALRALESEAKAAHRGIWAAPVPPGPRRSVQYATPTDLPAFLAAHKDVPINAIIEQTSNAATMRVRLMFSNEEHAFANVTLAGVRAPLASSNAPSAGTATMGSPEGDQAHFFAASRLLQRRVTVTLLGLPGTGPPYGPNTSFIATVSHPAGEMAPLLLSHGLARAQDLHAALLGPERMGELRRAETEAKAARRGVWSSPSAPGLANGHSKSGSEYEAVVTRVWSADTVSVRPTSGPNADQERRLALSSVRAVRINDPKLAGLAVDAREFLRKRLIGKTVRIATDFTTKPGENGQAEARTGVTMRLPNGDNVAEMVIERGYATVIRHRRDDEDKSGEIDALHQAEARAQAEGKGLHSGKDVPAPKHLDASESHARATSFLAQFKRGGKTPAVVDFVSSGSRFKLLLPKHEAKVTLVLAGIRAPRAPRIAGASGAPGEKGEPFGMEALEFSSRRLFQRDVEVQVFDVDRAGGFIGALHLPKPASGPDANFAVQLVRAGLASVDERAAGSLPFGKDLQDAQAEAQRERKCMWQNYDEAAARAQAEASQERPVMASKEVIELVVSEIRSDGAMFVQRLQNGSIPVLEQFVTSFAAHHASPQAASGPAVTPRKGELVSAKFSQDGAWYRARIVVANQGKRTADVHFIDYGNGETLPFSALRPLPAEFKSMPPQASPATLSLVRLLDPSHEYGPDSIDQLRALTDGRRLAANLDWRDPAADNLLYLTLYDAPVGSPTLSDPAQSINASIIRDGLARVQSKGRLAAAYPANVAALEKAHQEARRAHAGALQYGDFEDDDAVDERRRR